MHPFHRHPPSDDLSTIITVLVLICVVFVGATEGLPQ